jgi:hypothetical protein
MARRRINYAPLFAFLLVAASLILFLVRNQSHADSKHVAAQTVRAAYREQTCEGTEVYYSIVRGTILVLCGIPDSRKTGGIIFRVTENQGTRWLGEDAYECSAFVAERSYWNRVILRDGYVLLATYPNVERLFNEWYWSMQ